MKQASLIILVLCVAVAAGLLIKLPDHACHDAPSKTAFRPREFFNGHLQSWGLFQDYTGAAVARFSMQADASWKGNKGSMHEAFIFADGRHKERQWAFTAADDRHFAGAAPDVTGAAKGEACGNELHWVYTITLAIGDSEYEVDFDDRLYLIDKNHLFSKVRITKWGLPVGRLTMFFEKRH
jgi:hypothetical protein